MDELEKKKRKRIKLFGLITATVVRGGELSFVNLALGSLQLGAEQVVAFGIELWMLRFAASTRQESTALDRCDPGRMFQ